MQLADFRGLNKLFWSPRASYLGQAEGEPEPLPVPEPAPEPEPEPLPPPPPPPEPVCTKYRHPFHDGLFCFQFFECKHPDGSITYKKEPVTCPPKPIPVPYFYPYPVYAPPPPPSAYQVSIPIEKTEAKSTLEKIAPYGAAAIGVAGLAYLLLR